MVKIAAPTDNGTTAEPSGAATPFMVSVAHGSAAAAVTWILSVKKGTATVYIWTSGENTGLTVPWGTENEASAGGLTAGALGQGVQAATQAPAQAAIPIGHTSLPDTLSLLQAAARLRIPRTTSLMSNLYMMVTSMQ
jgi:hypothetical protein